MSTPSACRLRQDAFRLLLTGIGCRRVYLPFPAAAADRAGTIRQLARLMQAGLLQNNTDRLQILPPLDGWLRTVAFARRVVRLRAPGTLYPESCLYAGAEAIVCAAVEATQPDHVRLCSFPRESLWQELCELSPSLELPCAPPQAQAVSAAPIPETQPLDGEVFRLQLYRADSDAVEQLCAVWGAGFYLLSDGQTAVPWTPQAVQARLEEWLVNNE